MKIERQTISLSGLRFFAYHGAEVQEAVSGGWYRVDVDINADVRKAIDSDSLNDTINYARVAEIVRHEMEIPSKLIEHVAGRISNELNRCFGNRIHSMTVKIIKESPPVCSVCEESSFSLSLNM